MKTPLLLFLCLILLQNTGNAQIIPGATQQPAWVFPFYFEDGTGQKDTVYLGYDPFASVDLSGSGTADSIFGERVILVDTSEFNAFVHWAPMNNMGYLTEYRYKVAIVPDGFNDVLQYRLYAQNIQLPLKVKWNPTLLYSNSLPFPSQLPLPTAQVNCTINIPTSDGNCYPLDALPLLLSDTTLQPGCVYSDSVSFGDIGQEEYTEFFINIYPWIGYILGITEPTPPTLQLYPNPAGNSLTLESTLLTQPSPFSIINAQGQLVYQGSFSGNNSSVDVSALAPGVYVILLMDEEGRRVRFVKG